MAEGFQLNAVEVVEEIRGFLRTPGAHMATYMEAYSRPEVGMMVTDPVDRAVLIIVGSREQIDSAATAARSVLTS